ncbi:hypothetical protein [Allokutzneria oryzae]|uniref:Asp23/Gls24 family envelope stress response protein n=1 Tax=Allokutzneria oryzae TaxID=1378989 RepID=A0ABV6A8W5_9PSEU
MSAPTLDRSTAQEPVHVPEPRPEPSEPEERGALEIHPGVLRKLVQRIADDAPDTLRTRGRLGGEHGTTARITGGSGEIDVALELALRYPVPVREAVAALRERVVDEVGRVTGYRVRTVDVTVSALLPENQPARVE